MRTFGLAAALAAGLAVVSSASALTIDAAIQKKCSGYRYQALEGPKPFLLLYSDGVRPEFLVDHADRLVSAGFDGILLGNIMGNQTSDVWAADKDPSSAGEADATLQAARRANAACRRAGMTRNFLLASFSGQLPDWWDDIAWAKIHDNFRQAARFARAAGFAGICIDSEYVGEQYQYLWPGYTFDHYTVADLRRMARARMSQMAAAMYDEFPQMEFFLVHGVDTPIAVEMFAGWVEEAARRDAPGGLQLATEGTYSACSVPFILADAVDHFRVVEERLSTKAKEYWRKRCGLSPGGWPLSVSVDFDGKPFKQARLNLEEFRAMMAGLNMASAKYNWIYPNGPSWWQADEEEVKQYRLSSSAALAPIANLKEYHRIAGTPEQVDDANMKRASRALRTMSVSDPDQLLSSLGLRAVWTVQHPGNRLARTFIPADYRAFDGTARQADRIAADEELGRRPNVTSVFGFVREFSVIGPFSNERWEGHARPYPPEQKIDFNATYDGISGPVRWQQITVPDGQGFVDFASLMKPKDWTVAYALCYVHSATSQRAEIRTGTNDAIKMWFNGRLVADYQTANGRWAIVDDDIVPVTLLSGWSTILVKVAQTVGNWGMYLRITDQNGVPLRGLQFAARRR